MHIVEKNTKKVILEDFAQVFVKVENMKKEDQKDSIIYNVIIVINFFTLLEIEQKKKS